MNKKALYERFINAILDDDYETIKKCVQLGVDVNQPYDCNGSLPLYLCLQKNKNPKVFEYLVKHGADVTRRVGDPHLKEWQKNSLLYFALTFHDVPIEIVKTILTHGGDRDINYAPKGQRSPAEKAYIDGNKDLLKFYSKFCDIKIGPELMKNNKR